MVTCCCMLQATWSAGTSLNAKLPLHPERFLWVGSGEARVSIMALVCSVSEGLGVGMQ